MRKSRDELGNNDWDGRGHDGVWSFSHLYSTKDAIETESGPSRITIDDLERRDREKKECKQRQESTRPRQSRDRRRRRQEEVDITRSKHDTTAHSRSTTSCTSHRRRRLPLPTSIVASFALCPITFGAPTRTATATATDSLLPRDTPIPTTTPAADAADEQYAAPDLRYLTSMSTPTKALPTDVYVVDERRLPFYMTQNDDGSWTKVEDAWFLYGRRAGDVSTANFSPDDDPNATAVPTTLVSGTSQFAITDNLPPGWGIEATRSNFYMTPLIVAMSVILALMIVAGIIFIVIKRRKQHHRAKRRAARLRRKALAAAGLTEEDINNDRGGDVIDSALREKLAEIDKITVNKTNPDRKRRTSKERGPTAVIRTKVRSWNQGVGILRRRKGGLGPTRSNTPSIEVIDEEKEDDPNAPVHGRGSTDTERTTPTVASHSSNDRAGTSGSGSRDATTSDSNGTPSSTELSRAVTGPPPIAANTLTYFPPAYRPASVRSLQVHSTGTGAGAAGSSPPQEGSSASSSSGPSVVSPREKTNVPGYYPAPATEDSEVALAVASRSDGKRRMDVAAPEEEEEEANRIRHIATDDKQVLERMRMGGSAPPQQQQTAGFGGPGIVQQGASAPEVDVDEHGFERPDPAILQVPPLSENGIAHDIEETPSSSPLPLPPPQRPSRSYRLYSQDDLGVDDRHLLPSAPPPPAHPDHLTPSAPPLQPDEEHAPSAPAFDEGEEAESGVEGGDEYARTDTQDTVSSREHDHDHDHDHEHDEEDRAIPMDQTRNPSLPLYEP